MNNGVSACVELRKENETNSGITESMNITNIDVEWKISRKLCSVRLNAWLRYKNLYEFSAFNTQFSSLDIKYLWKANNARLLSLSLTQLFEFRVKLFQYPEQNFWLGRWQSTKYTHIHPNTHIHILTHKVYTDTWDNHSFLSSRALIIL